jgi:hypothetical protein
LEFGSIRQAILSAQNDIRGRIHARGRSRDYENGIFKLKKSTTHSDEVSRLFVSLENTQVTVTSQVTVTFLILDNLNFTNIIRKN